MPTPIDYPGFDPANSTVTISPNEQWTDPLWFKAFQQPAFDLDFTQQSIIDRINNVSGTFTRPSSTKLAWNGSQYVEYAADVPAFQCDTVSGLWGLLMEPAATNVLLWSQDASQWLTPNGITLTVDAGVSPDGTTTADRYIETTDDGFHSQQSTAFVFVSGTLYTYSIYVKPIGGANYEIGFPVIFGSSRFARFSLSGSGSVQGTDDGVTASIIPLSDGWYRCIASSTCVTGSGSRIVNFINNAGFTRSYVGDTGKGLFVWQAQLETGPVATTPIVTTGSTATRNADSFNFTGSAFSSWYNQLGGTVYIEAMPYGLTANTNWGLASISSGTYDNSLTQFLGGPSAVSAVIDNGTTQAYINDSPLVSAGSLLRYAAGYQANNFGRSINGAEPAVDLLGTMPAGLNRLDIGRAPTAIDTGVNVIHRFAYFPPGPAQSRLQQLTAS